MCPAQLPDVQRLRVLVSVARAGTFAEAAKNMGVSASAVSQQLAQLEREVGVELLQRRRRGVSLTSAGEALSEQAATALGVLEQTQALICELRGDVGGRLTIGTIASVVRPWVFPAVEQLERRSPAISCAVITGEPASTVERLVAGDLDLAIIDVYDHVPVALPKQLGTVELGVDPLVLVTAKNSGPQPAIAELAESWWVMPPEDAACGHAVRYVCREGGFEPRVALETDDLQLLAAGVSRKRGIALLPNLVVAGYEDIETHFLRDVEPQRRILATYRTSSSKSPTLQLAIDALTRVSSPWRPREPTAHEREQSG